MDFGNVPPDLWYYAALSPGLLIGTALLLRRGRTAPAAVGLAFMMLSTAVEAPALLILWAATSAVQATWMGWLVFLVGYGFWLSGYVWVIGYVPAGWNAWMRRPSFKLGMAALIFGAAIWSGSWTLNNATFVGGPGDPIAFDDPAFGIGHPPLLAHLALTVTILAASLAVAVSASMRATPGISRRSAFAYLVGIGTVDVLMIWRSLADFWPSLFPGPLEAAWPWIYPTLFGVWLPAWIAYAVLSTRLFDIDLRIKWAIDKGSLVAIFVAVFFGVGLFMQEWLTQSFGLLGGAMAAAALFLVLAPLRRFTASIASRLMPDAVATPAYTTHRKVEIYREALRDTLETGGSITASERRLLDRLRDQLGLDAPSVAVLESEARAA